MAPTVDRIASDATLPKQVDAVVIGGGIIGVSAAYHLAQKGHSVALLEKGNVAAEQSSRNWGWCRVQGRSIPELPLAKHSLEVWGGFNEAIGGDTGFRRTGLLTVTKDPKEVTRWEDWTERAREYQVHGRVLTSAEVAELVPATNERWLGGFYSPTDGRAEPSKAAPAIAEGARRLGATIHQQCAARGLETKGGRVSAVVTERGTIATDTVLCAGGAWTSLFCRRHGIGLPQAGVFASACRTEPGPEVTQGGISTGGYAFRRREDGGYTVAVGGAGRVELTPQGLRYAWTFLPLFLKRRRKLTLGIGRSFLSGPEALAKWSFEEVSPFEKTRVLDPAPDPNLIDRAMNQLRADYPALRDLRVAEAWGGFIDSTPDATPVISGVEKLPGFYLAAGFSGHGFGLGAGAGRLAADLMAGDPPIVDPTPFRYSRFIDGTRLRPTGWM